jgi:phosphopantothenoylcysteine decarboxylase/phosphopantothenate--cysteine ligase
LRILLGITGGIAAYKAANLIRAFSEQGHIVQEKDATEER